MSKKVKHGQQQQQPEFVLAPDLARQARAQVDAPPKVTPAQAKAANKRGAVQFGARHAVLIAFFLWLLYVSRDRASEIALMLYTVSSKS